MELLSIEDYINNLSEIENSVIGKSFFGFDFDSYSANIPIEYYFDLCDFSDFNLKYKQNFDNFIDYCNKNSVALKMKSDLAAVKGA